MRSILAVVTAVIFCCGNAFAVPPDPSPGLPIGQTAYDMQNNSMGRQVARARGADIVHFTWMCWNRIPQSIDDNDRYVAYSSLNIPSWFMLVGFGGVPALCPDRGTGLCGLARDGFPSMSVTALNHAEVGLHAREDPWSPYRAWHLSYPIPGNVLVVSDELSAATPDQGDVLWPKVDVQQTTGVLHEIAQDAETEQGPGFLWYWRFNGTLWTGPVIIDSPMTSCYDFCSDYTSEKCAVFFFTPGQYAWSSPREFAYYESQTAGVGWLDGSELGSANLRTITSYDPWPAARGGNNVSAAYDNDGTLQVVWDELIMEDFPTFEVNETTIKHWNPNRGSIRRVAIGNWYLGVPYESQLDKLTIGIGDGGTVCNGSSNRNYLYVLHTRFGGPTQEEQEDISANGYHNGELYLSVSPNGGGGWYAPVNLTNTKTPGCNPGPADTLTGLPQNPDSVCRSENWASIGKVVDDIDILFISDLDAGAIPYAEGTWQLNPVHYLRFPGATTDSPVLCPSAATALTSMYYPPPLDACGIHASGDDTVFNSAINIVVFGGLPVSGRVRIVYTDPPAPESDWLQVGGQQIVPFSLHPLSMSQPWIEGVTTLAAGLARGTYNAEIRVEQSDSLLPPFDVHLVTFNVDPCSQYGDPVHDGATNVQDVIAVIDAAFRGIPESPDAFCTVNPINASGVTDVNCSGTTDVVDVVSTVGVAFRGLSAVSTFCNPCASQSAMSSSIRATHRPGDRRPVY